MKENKLFEKLFFIQTKESFEFNNIYLIRPQAKIDNFAFKSSNIILEEII